jgi:hypothetical protein
VGYCSHPRECSALNSALMLQLPVDVRKNSSHGSTCNPAIPLQKTGAFPRTHHFQTRHSLYLKGT